MEKDKKEFVINVSENDPFGGGFELLCPICGKTNAGEYQHFLGKPEIIDGKDDYKAGWSGRGDRAVIGFSGECGHNWSLNFAFHKGNIFMFWNKLEGSMYEDEAITCMDCHKVVVVDKKRCLSCAVKR